MYIPLVPSAQEKRTPVYRYVLLGVCLFAALFLTTTQLKPTAELAETAVGETPVGAPGPFYDILKDLVIDPNANDQATTWLLKKCAGRCDYNGAAKGGKHNCGLAERVWEALKQHPTFAGQNLFKPLDVYLSPDGGHIGTWEKYAQPPNNKLNKIAKRPNAKFDTDLKQMFADNKAKNGLYIISIGPDHVFFLEQMPAVGDPANGGTPTTFRIYQSWIAAFALDFWMDTTKNVDAQCQSSKAKWSVIPKYYDNAQENWDTVTLKWLEDLYGTLNNDLTTARNTYGGGAEISLAEIEDLVDHIFASNNILTLSVQKGGLHQLLQDPNFPQLRTAWSTKKWLGLEAVPFSHWILYPNYFPFKLTTTLSYVAMPAPANGGANNQPVQPAPAANGGAQGGVPVTPEPTTI